MAKVKTVRAHQNMYGDKPDKKVGDEYELADNMVPTLVAAGLVEEAKASKASKASTAEKADKA